jgi:hypothetical protein
LTKATRSSISFIIPQNKQGWKVKESKISASEALQFVGIQGSINDMAAPEAIDTAQQESGGK